MNILVKFEPNESDYYWKNLNWAQISQAKLNRPFYENRYMTYFQKKKALPTWNLASSGVCKEIYFTMVPLNKALNCFYLKLLCISHGFYNMHQQKRKTFLHIVNGVSNICIH